MFKKIIRNEENGAPMIFWKDQRFDKCPLSSTMYGYFNNDPLLSCSAFHYVSTMLFPISNIHEKETRKQQQQTNEKRQKN